VFIPKPGRPDEQRPLSIPTVRDRVVQAAAKLVIEPAFEADFLPCSFGFRPKRAAHDALQVLIDEFWRGRRWVVETDIADCYEAIPHDRLMAAIEERVVDRKLLKLLRAMLCAGVMEEGGPPRGGRYSAEPCDFTRALQRLPAPTRPAIAGARVRSAAPVRGRSGGAVPNQA
jgi:Reverse transcriptase (RNA-dependent DNA polymerase)